MSLQDFVNDSPLKFMHVTVSFPNSSAPLAGERFQDTQSSRGSTDTLWICEGFQSWDE